MQTLAYILLEGGSISAIFNDVQQKYHQWGISNTMTLEDNKYFVPGASYLKVRAA
jgi:hypothetical protein